MIKLGLTGSIGMGKTTVAGMFAAEGAPVFDSDAAVHALYEVGGAAIAPVGAAFPGVVKDGAIDRSALSAAVLHDAAAIQKLEHIVHPLVAAAQNDFLAAHADAPIVLFDVPLLFETGAEGRFDKIIVVSAPAAVQRERVLSRPGMSEAKFAAILARQTPDAEKRARADFVIDTSGPLQQTHAQVRAILDDLAETD